jgi:catechol 2,3-dioxygenase-like lactoylglutathione lyase family enzyme
MKTTLRLPLLVASAVLLATDAMAQTKRPPLVGIDHVAFRTSNAAAVRAFYGEVLGLGVDDRTPAPTVTINARQRVFVEPGLPADTDERLGHIALATPDLPTMATYLRERGVNVAGPSVGTPCGSRGLRVIDPDGHTIEFVQESAIASGATASATALSTRLLHAGVTVRSEAAASAFYHDVLGMDEIWRGGFEPAKTNWVNMRLPESADYVEYMLREAPSSRRQLGVDHHICLLVPDIQQAWEQVRQRTTPDKRAALEPPRIGRNQKWQLNLYDPDGTRVELMEPFNVR